MSIFSRVLAKLPLCAAGAAALVSVAGHANAAATSTATLQFSGASFTGGDSYGGSITYDYVGTSLSQIDSASIVITSGGVNPSFTFYYNVPGQTTNVVAPQITVNDATNGLYELKFIDNTFTYVTQPDFEGIGGLADLVSAFSGGATSYTVNTASGVTEFLSNAGTSTAFASTATGSPIPEPASLALISSGVFGLGLLRRLRRSA